jgi:D-alanyl-D-alanine endopeptidase (penicillin-binding protein 7)
MKKYLDRFGVALVNHWRAVFFILLFALFAVPDNFILATFDDNASFNLEEKAVLTVSDIQNGKTISGLENSFKLIVPAMKMPTTTDAIDTEILIPNIPKDIEVDMRRMNEDWAIPWNLTKISHFYQFELSDKLPQQFEIQISYAENKKLGEYKQVFYYDKNSETWKPLPTRDYPLQKFVRARTSFYFGRLAVFSYPEVITTGKASWYKYKGGDFAASPDFPAGSKIRVYNTANEKYVDVTINDYGPNRLLYADRAIDLDKKAFEKIASLGAGMVNVRLEPLEIKTDKFGNTLNIAPSGAEIKPKIVAAAALIITEKDHKIILEKNADKAMPIASLSKLVAIKTFLDIGNNRQRLNEIVKYSTEDEKKNYVYCKPAESARLKMKNGDKLTIKDLIYSSLISSTNNTVETLVRYSGLSREDFIKKMNENAQAWGATSAKFIEPTGLSPKNVASAKDYAIIIVKAGSDSIITRASATLSYTLKNINGQKTHTIHNSNALLGLHRYPITLAKTGFLYEAGYCLANRVKAGDDNLIVITFNNNNRNLSFRENEQLLIYGLNKMNQADFIAARVN